MKTITLDTNVLPAERLLESAARLGFHVAVITVTGREVQGTRFETHLQSIATIDETGVYGEARYGRARYASPTSALSEILRVVSNGSFLRPRTSLSEGQRRQLRDALIFEAHVRDRRDLFITRDERAFVRDDRWQALETRFNTRIMTPEEFLQACDSGRWQAAV